MFTRARHPLFLAVPVLLLASVVPQAATCVTLESVYSGASAQNGYDKYVVLTAGATYTGGLTIPYGTTACIKGNGAIIDLQAGMIHVGGSTTRLDIDHCVLVNGGDPVYGPGQSALNFVASYGSVVNNTIYDSTVGVRVYSTPAGAVSVKNCILSDNGYAGVICELGCEANITYNDGWNNFRYGNYAIDYYCVNGGIQSWTPSPGTGNISANPLFMDAAVLDFGLDPESPCIGAGDPVGTDMGALGTGSSGGDPGGGGDELGPEIRVKTYHPVGITMLRGTVESGSQADLGANEGIYVNVSAAKSGNKYYTDWYSQTAIEEKPLELTITYDGKYSTSRTQTLYLYNFRTGSWTQVKQSSVGTTDVTASYTTDAVAAFVSPMGEIRVRVAVDANSKVYSCYGDYVAYTIKYAVPAPSEPEPKIAELSGSSSLDLAGGPALTPPVVPTGLEAWPNPFNPTVRIAFELEMPTTGVLSVYDVSGRKLVELTRGALEAGRHVVVWDGRDSEGKALSSGTYIARLDGDGVSQSLKLVMLK